MCGISGFFNQKKKGNPDAERHLEVMNRLQKHRGPDGEGVWVHPQRFIGFSHVRLSIIDLGTGQQPMIAPNGDAITFNGEIYNYIELREELKDSYNFKTTSDTEAILAAYQKWGCECVNHLRGMFAFAIWDESEGTLFCARDRFGIKPFYYTVQNGTFYFASEAKTLLPFVPDLSMNEDAFVSYLTFQFSLNDTTLFNGIEKLLPGHCIKFHKNGTFEIQKYWEVYYQLDWDHSEHYFLERVKELLEDSVRVHLRADVPVGAYVSGGLDSSIIGTLGSKYVDGQFEAFIGKFTCYEGFDESMYARDLAKMYNMKLWEEDISCQDFINDIRKVIYHLDEPVAGPGSFPQYCVSRLAAKHRKVVLGGQGGDEIFGGYTRYLIAYFEQCIKGAIEGTLNNGNFIVTYESIIPNLRNLRNYKPLMKTFWKEGLFDDISSRYFRLVNRAPDMEREINWDAIHSKYQVIDDYDRIFLGSNVGHTAYFDLMTHFDFKTLLPALLQVEDRMSMAHGLESRVPFLDHPLIEFLATIPPNVKFQNGELKRMLMKAFGNILPPSITGRKDKMGFPVPLNQWMKTDLKDFVLDIFKTQERIGRPYFNTARITDAVEKEGKFSRKVWGLLSLELWHQEFLDKASDYRKMIA